MSLLTLLNNNKLSIFYNKYNVFYKKSYYHQLNNYIYKSNTLTFNNNNNHINNSSVNNKSLSNYKIFYYNIRKLSTSSSSKSIHDSSSYTQSYINSQYTISYWLFGCCLIVFFMVVVGGITRLTRSGLSMVYWKPLGHLPPITHEEWIEEFNKYKKFPEYNSLGREMSLDEFKFIYFFEYSHRMLGRVLGVAFALPFIYFNMRRLIPATINKNLLSLFVLGGLQGYIGWWMVSSGLDRQKHSYNDLPRVSPYRLATHLISAFIIFGGLFSTALRVRSMAKIQDTLLKVAKSGGTASTESVAELPKWFIKSSQHLKYLIGLTIVSGAFVAGNEAGLGYNEFPYMGDGLIPTDLVNPVLTPIQNIFENSVMVQFNHRYLGMTTASISLGLLYFGSKLNLSPKLRLCLRLIGFTALGQMTLGILTLINYVPINLAATHQAGSMILFTNSLWLSHLVSKPPVVALPAVAGLFALSFNKKVTNESSNKVIRL